MTIKAKIIGFPGKKKSIAAAVILVLLIVLIIAVTSCDSKIESAKEKNEPAVKIVQTEDAKDQDEKTDKEKKKEDAEKRETDGKVESDAKSFDYTASLSSETEIHVAEDTSDEDELYEKTKSSSTFSSQSSLSSGNSVSDDNDEEEDDEDREPRYEEEDDEPVKEETLSKPEKEETKKEEPKMEPEPTVTVQVPIYEDDTVYWIKDYDGNVLYTTTSASEFENELERRGNDPNDDMYWHWGSGGVDIVVGYKDPDTIPVSVWENSGWYGNPDVIVTYN